MITNIQFSHTREELLDTLYPTEDDGHYETGEPVRIDFEMDLEFAGGMRRASLSHQVPMRFLTDLISAPASVLLKMGIKPKDYIFAPLFHDSGFRWPVVICTTPGFPQTMRLDQKQWDQLFKAVLLREGLDEGRAHFMYKILRNWGWVAWLKWRFVSLMGGFK